MVENIEEFCVKSQLYMFGDGEPFGDIEITPEEIRSVKGVAARVPELAVLRRVSSVASSGGRIHRGDKSVGIEPLNRSWLRDARNIAISAVRIDARHDAGKLRSASLHDSVSIRRVWRTQHGERHSAVPEHAAGDLPTVEGIAKRMVVKLYRELIDILAGEIVADIVIAITVVALEVARQW